MWSEFYLSLSLSFSHLLPSSKFNYIRQMSESNGSGYVRTRKLSISLSFSLLETTQHVPRCTALHASQLFVYSPPSPQFGKLGTRPPPRRDKALRLERGPRLNWKFCVYCIMRSYYVKVYHRGEGECIMGGGERSVGQESGGGKDGCSVSISVPDHSARSWLFCRAEGIFERSNRGICFEWRALPDVCIYIIMYDE